MIGDSWQLRKHSLLGHWPVHSVEPPGPWRTCENGKRRGKAGGRWGWANKSRNRRDGELAKNQQGQKCCTCWRMEAERHIQTDGWRGGWRYRTKEAESQMKCRNKSWNVRGGNTAITLLHSCSRGHSLAEKWGRTSTEPGRSGQQGRLGEEGLSLVSVLQ